MYFDYELILVMVLLCTVPLVIALVISYRSSMSKSLEDAETINAKKATVVEKSYMLEIEKMVSSLQTIASNRDLVTNMGAPENERDDEAMQMPVISVVVLRSLRKKSESLPRIPEPWQMKYDRKWMSCCRNHRMLL